MDNAPTDNAPTTFSGSTCRSCGQPLADRERLSPLMLCGACCDRLPFAPRTVDGYTVLLLWELEQRPEYQMMSSDHQQAVRRGIVQAGLDLILEGSDKYYATLAKRRNGRPLGRPKGRTYLTKDTFCERYERCTHQHPYASKTAVAEELGISVSTLKTYIARYGVKPLAHWR